METLYNFLEKNSLYIVLIIVLLVWIGIFSFAYKLDKKVKKLEESIKE
ncbi:MAG: CcmD family protein [Ignavibacteria bacterium]|nr:CcmD family protein [Ignavibacteria bacterium]